MSESPPRAEIQRRPNRRLPWLLPFFALLFALYLGADAWLGTGPTITILAEEGHGLGIGDPLRYRGVDVGRLSAVELTEDLEQVSLSVRLVPEAAGLCREGSQFWIVRPRMAVDSVQGLETIVGARYLSVKPGELSAPAQYHFAALGDPPSTEVIDEAGLELRLEAPKRSNLGPGSQITYRGIVIGSVLSSALASDAGSVEIRAYVRPEYRELIRTNSWFWNTGGLEVSLALAGGLSIEMDSLRSLVVGGIALATPTEAGEAVEDGARFFLHSSAHEDMADWRPLLFVGDSEELGVDASRHQVRATLSFRAGRLIKRDTKREGWVVVLPRGVLGPAELLGLPEGVDAADATLTIAGAEVPLEVPPTWEDRGLVLRETESRAGEAIDPTAVQFAPELQDCLAYVPDRSMPLSLSRTRMRSTPEGWQIDSDFEIDSSWNGALIHARTAKRFVGILLVEDEGARIAPFMAQTW